MATYVGRPLKRFEDPRLVTGQGSFVDDLRLPGMLHAVVLRSPHAHARILSIDAAPARALPGVAAVLTASDIAGAVRDIPPRPTRELEGMQVPEHPCWPATKSVTSGSRGGSRGPGPLYRQRCSGSAAGGI